MNARRYIGWFFTAFFALAVFTATINLVIDPYLIFGSPRIEGLNREKTEINDYVRLAKAFEPFRRNTDVVIAGNSRIEIGLDPDHFCFKKLGLDVYNLGIPGATVEQQLNYALNVVYAQPVKRIFLSVDFVDFLAREETVPSPRYAGLETGNLPKQFDGSNHPEYKLTVALTRFKALLSLNAFIDSVKTLLLQGKDSPNRLANGFNPARDFVKATAIEGPGALFEQKMVTLRQRFETPMSIYDSDDTFVKEFDLVSRFLDIAAVEGVEVVVLTNPFHEQFWRLLSERDLIDMHADWLNEIQNRVRMAPGRATMWDFSSESEFIHELVPAPELKAPALEWFWEPSHYRKRLGDKMIDAMLGTECGVQASFGRQIISNS